MLIGIDKGVLLAGVLALAAPAALAQNPAQTGPGPQSAAPPQPPQHNVLTPRPSDLRPPLPFPPAEHRQIPPLPYGSSGYVYDAHTGQYVAPGRQAIWVKGHWQDQPGGRVWVPAQWMYPVASGSGR